MANLQATLRSHCQRTIDSLAELANAVNRYFFKSTDPEHFATAFLGEYDDRDRTLRYVNCGHNAPLLRRADGLKESLEPTGTVIGAFESYHCSEAEVRIDPADTLVICSDGVLEARDTAENQFGASGLKEILWAHHDMPIQELPTVIAEAVSAHSTYGQEDDLTLIVARGV
jgi:sigma-B regulation protein RsbU (phosphoserine phosphatase)